MERREIYRMIAGEQFDLLTDDEKRRLADSLTGRPDVDPVDVARRLRVALSGSTEPERERAFSDALAAARASIDSMRPVVPRRRGAGPLRGVWRYALAAAAGAAVVWLAIGAPRVRDDGAPAVGIGAGHALFLGADRSPAEPSVDIDSVAAPHITLVVEFPADDAVVRWRLVDNAGNEPLRGAVDRPVGDESALRTLAVRVPTLSLGVARQYWLILEDAGGTTLHRWSFNVD